MSSRYETNLASKNPSANQTPQDNPNVPSSSTYEKIGVLDVSVYSNCDYQQKVKDNTSGHDLRKKYLSQKLKMVLLVVCAVVLAVVLVASLALGITGVAKTYFPAAAKCKTEERSTLFNDTSHTDALTMAREGYSLISAFCVHNASNGSNQHVVTSLHHNSPEDSISCTCHRFGDGEPATAPLACTLRVTRCPKSFIEES